MRIIGVAAAFAIVFSGLASATGEAPEVQDGLTIAGLGASEAVRLDTNNPTIGFPVSLSSNFRQGDNNRWLMFRIHFRISYPSVTNVSADTISDIQHVLSASIGSSTAVQIVAKRERGKLSANGIGWAEGSVTKFSTSDTIEMTYSNYFPEYLAPEGEDELTELRLTFEISERASDAYAEVFLDSGFVETSQSPDSLMLDILDIDTFNDDDGNTLAVIHYSIVNERSITAELKLAFFEDNGDQIPLYEPKQHALLGYQSVQGEAVVPIQHPSQDFRGDLVVISDEFNNPSVAIELLKKSGPSYLVHIIGLVVGGLLLIFGSFFVVRLINMHMNAKRKRSEYRS